MNEKPMAIVTDLSKGKKYEISYMGQTISCISKRNYSHIIIGISSKGNLVDFNYCGRLDLALNKLNQLKKEIERTESALEYLDIERSNKITNLQIVEVK